MQLAHRSGVLIKPKYSTMVLDAAGWKVGPPMIDGLRTRHTATVLGGRLYVIGGNTGIAGSLEYSCVVEYLDPAIGQWRQTGEMVTVRSDHVTTVLLDKLVVVGGIGSSGRYTHAHSLSASLAVLLWMSHYLIVSIRLSQSNCPYSITHCLTRTISFTLSQSHTLATCDSNFASVMIMCAGRWILWKFMTQSVSAGMKQHRCLQPGPIMRVVSSKGSCSSLVVKTAETGTRQLIACDV